MLHKSIVLNLQRTLFNETAEYLFGLPSWIHNRDIWKNGLISNCKIMQKSKIFPFSFTGWELYHVGNYNPKEHHSTHRWCYLNYFSDCYFRAQFFFPLLLTYPHCYSDISSEFSPPKPRRDFQVNFQLFILYLLTDTENISAMGPLVLKLSYANSFPIMGPPCLYLTWLYLNFVL